MNRAVIYTVILVLAGGMVFAGGNPENAVNGREPFEIISLKGTVEEDGYGHPLVVQGGKNYLVRVAPTLDVEVSPGEVIEGEGVLGRTLYRKDNKDYIEFFLTMAVVDGETRTVDTDRVNRFAPGGMNGRDAWGGPDLGASRRYMPGNGGRMDWTGRYGGTAAPGLSDRWDGLEAEEITLTGTLTLYDDIHPVLTGNEGTYLLMMGPASHNIDWEEGAAVEATGYPARALYNEDGEEYHSLRVTSVAIDGEEIELDVPGMTGFMGGPLDAMGGRRGGKTGSGRGFRG